MIRSRKPTTLTPITTAIFVLAAIAALAVLSIGGGEAEAGITHTVFVNNDRFCDSAGSDCSQPHSIQISAGNTVQWLDGQSGGTHTVTQCTGDGTGCPAGGGFDSGVKSDPKAGYLAHVFPDEGTFFFRCQIHGNSMRGIVMVIGPATDTPTPVPGTPTDSPGDDSPTATPADVPKTGGEPGSGGLPLILVVLALGGALAVAGSSALYAARRR